MTSNTHDDSINQQVVAHTRPITNYSRLQAQMLNENMQSGIALNETTFNTSSVFAEYSKGETLKFHIYPIIDEVSKSLIKNSDKHRETEEEKLNYLTVETNNARAY